MNEVKSELIRSNSRQPKQNMQLRYYGDFSLKTLLGFDFIAFALLKVVFIFVRPL